MSKSDAWMPLHIGDYLSDTMRLTTVQHGAYLLLLMQYWKSGPLADDDEELAGIARMDTKSWGKISTALRRFFVVGEDGLLHQKRADQERAKAVLISQKRRDAVAQRADRQTSTSQQGDMDDGSSSGSNGQQNDNNGITNVTDLKARLNTHARTELQPQEVNQEPKSVEDSRSLRSLVRSEPKSRAAKADAGFAAFYAAFPRKQQPDDGLRAWRQVLAHGATPDEIMAGLERHEFTDEPKFLPLPASWLRAGSWKDEPLPRQQSLSMLDRVRRDLGLDAPLTIDHQELPYGVTH